MVSWSRSRFRWPVAALLVAVSLGAALPPAQAQWARHPVLSEVFAGGGNTGAAFSHDFIELYNPTPQPVSLDGWSVQYASARGSFARNQPVALTGTIPPFGYFLIQGAAGASGAGAPLPPPDAVSSLNLSNSGGQVALVQGLEPVTGPDDPRVVDFLGYGDAAAFEGGAPGPRGSNTRSLQRLADGGHGPGEGTGPGWDTDENSLDWITGPPTPRSSLAPPEPPARPQAVIHAFPHVVLGEPATLDGRASWDPGGDPLTFRWTLAARPPGSLAKLDGAGEPVAILVADRAGQYQVTLTVSDGILESLPARVTLTAGQPPAELITHGPNPAHTAVTFFYLRDEAADLWVYDVAGRVVHQARLSPGPSQHRWDLTDPGGRPVAAGLYLYLVVTEGGARSPVHRLVVAR